MGEKQASSIGKSCLPFGETQKHVGEFICELGYCGVEEEAGRVPFV